MTRKGHETRWPHPPSESEEEAAEHGPAEHMEDNLPQGQGREGVDWMEFDKPGGGRKRKMVNLGIQEEESQR